MWSCKKKNRFIIVRVTHEQHERIHNNAKATGNASISQYVRGLALEQNLTTQMRIKENNSLLRQLVEEINKTGKIQN
jgi:hypothetical protein